MDLQVLFIVISSLALFAQSLFSLYLMLYSWDHPERLEAAKSPSTFAAPSLSFAVLLPARHEEAVIYDTIKRVFSANYPASLLEIVVVCHADDDGTIAEAQRAAMELGSHQVRVETFAAPPISKPHGLNVGFQRTTHQVVTIFDAEDDIHPDIFNVVNTAMLKEKVGIVQAGVQLINFRDHWFSLHNCLEYYFWYKSRLHFHAAVGMIPLGGNTVFMRRDLIAKVGGWDENCLTEDADIGLRLSNLGERIRVIYDAAYATREETPDGVVSFIRQRTRWQQGFLQVLRKGTWRHLPRLSQRLLAIYTLAYPIVQSMTVMLWPLAILSALSLKVPVAVSIISFLPLYALLFQFLVTAVGAFLFTNEYNFEFPLLTLPYMAITFLPFLWLLSICSVRAVYREVRRRNNWEKTVHIGAHRQPAHTPALALDRLLGVIVAGLGAERASVMVSDPSDGVLAIAASRGIPESITKTARLGIGEGIAGWVALTGRPLLISGKIHPDDLSQRLHQPAIVSSIVVPIQQGGTTVAVMSVASTSKMFANDALQWLDDQIQDASTTLFVEQRRVTGLRMPKKSVN